MIQYDAFFLLIIMITTTRLLLIIIIIIIIIIYEFRSHYTVPSQKLLSLIQSMVSHQGFIYTSVVPALPSICHTHICPCGGSRTKTDVKL